jgi:AcrR family transcriptional regulator
LIETPRSGTLQTVSTARAPGRGKYDRRTSPEDRAKEQRRRLFAAATRVFAKKGFAGATVDAIVAEAGTSRRTFYEHFDDLKDVLLLLHDRIANASFRLIEECVRAQTHPNDQLRAGVEAFMGLIVHFSDQARVLFREVRAAGPEHEVRREALLSRFASLLFEGVTRAKALGIATKPPDELRIFALVAAMEAVAMRYVERRDESRASEAVDPLVDMVIRTFA